jgi:hypothetical protein
MGDRLDAIQELIGSMGPREQVEAWKLVLEELRYLRDQQAHAKHAAEEFARLMPR